MCSFENGFVFCSCGEEEVPKENYWVLYKYDKELPPERRKGKAAMLSYSSSEEKVRQILLATLNKHAFDWDYEPTEGDFLVCNLNKPTKKRYQFRYLSNKWEEDNSNSLTSWRSQLVTNNKGKVQTL